MQFTGEEYFRASTERMRQARMIHRAGGNSALAMYCGGLAVECLLRAFRWAKDRTFEGRHDLRDLLRASALLRINEEQMRRKGLGEDKVGESTEALRAATNEVVTLWHNNLRFASEASLRSYLNRIDRLKGIRGDALKKNASDLLEAAQIIIGRGADLWTSKQK